jgi:hypothetical protein
MISTVAPVVLKMFLLYLFEAKSLLGEKDGLKFTPELSALCYSSDKSLKRSRGSSPETSYEAFSVTV